MFKAMRPLRRDDLVRGWFGGYRDEADFAADSDVETFCALRLLIDSWRWAGVPWYLRSGKCLAETCAEVLVELKPLPQALFADSAPARGRANYLRFRLSPIPEIALAARVKRAGEDFPGDQREPFLRCGSGCLWWLIHVTGRPGAGRSILTNHGIVTVDVSGPVSPPPVADLARQISVHLGTSEKVSVHWTQTMPHTDTLAADPTTLVTQLKAAAGTATIEIRFAHLEPITTTQPQTAGSTVP